MKRNHVVIVAGGTGGHIRPGILIGQELLRRGQHVSWIGTHQGMEREMVKFCDFYSIYSKPFRVRGLWQKFRALLVMVFGVCSALRMLQKLKPDAILCMGGYVCVACGVSAKLLGIKVFLQEQNAVPGLANKVLSRFSFAIYAGYPRVFMAQRNVHFFGNPVQLKHVQARVKNTASKNLLVLGGSLGAESINACVIKALPMLHGFCVHHQVGKRHVGRYIKKQFQGYRVFDFIDDMQAAYQWADVIVCRAGAMTVSEIHIVNKPTILIPYPYAVDDHQTQNTKRLTGLNFCVLQECYLNPYRFEKYVKKAFCQPSRPLVSSVRTAQQKICQSLLDYI